jgi:hypothetical protein
MPFNAMFERRIQKEEIRYLLQSGEVIAEYPNDIPLPSSLLLGFLGDRPIHIVVAFDDSTKTCHIVTVYEPVLVSGPMTLGREDRNEMSHL